VKARQPGRQWPPGADIAAATAVLAFVALLSLFSIRNNDIWWHLAVGKILAGGSFITKDPFMFSVPGLPWVPHAWLSSLLFYAVFSLANVTGLVVLRAILVVGTFSVMLCILRRLRVPIAFAAPVVLVVALNAQSRFILRPHLVEYLFLSVLLLHLTTRGRRRDMSFYILPVVLQLLWVNMHASFYFGPLVVLLFFVGETIAARFPRHFSTIDGERDTVAWKQVGLLLVAMAAVSFLTPRPIEFLVQPLGAEQRELLRRYTLEWQSPFAAITRGAGFHPYYEIFLAFLAVTFVASLRRLRPAAWLLIGFFTVLSLEAHRFRVELGLVGVPMALAQLRDHPLVSRMAARAGGVRAALGVALALCVLLVATSWKRVEIGGAVSDRFPADAFEFVRVNDVAHRPFHTVGFGSYLIWDLYPGRQAFVDGRMIDVGLYEDFLACQSTSAGFNAVIRKYDLDAFVIPSPEKSDGGMRNVHGFLAGSTGWSLVHIDRNAFLYVKDTAVDGAWLGAHGYDFYNPLTFGQARFSGDQLHDLEAELDRAAAEDPRYPRPALDKARFLAGLGRRQEARAAVERVLEVDPGNEEAVALRRQLAGER
jgi:hypothetical protein